MNGYQKIKLMNFFAEASSLLILPLMLINMFGGIVSGIWLAILGEWGSIGTGLLLTIGGPWALSIPLGLSMLVMVPMLQFVEKIKNVYLQVPFTLVGASVTVAIMIGWAYLCQFVLLEGVSSKALVPLVLWTYGAITGPFIYMAQKEQQSGGGNEYTFLSLFFYQIASIICMVQVGFFDFDVEETLSTFIGVMSVGVIIQAIIMVVQTREQSSRFGY